MIGDLSRSPIFIRVTFMEERNDCVRYYRQEKQRSIKRFNKNILRNNIKKIYKDKTVEC